MLFTCNFIKVIHSEEDFRNWQIKFYNLIISNENKSEIDNMTYEDIQISINIIPKAAHLKPYSYNDFLIYLLPNEKGYQVISNDQCWGKIKSTLRSNSTFNYSQTEIDMLNYFQLYGGVFPYELWILESRTNFSKYMVLSSLLNLYGLPTKNSFIQNDIYHIDCEYVRSEIDLVYLFTMALVDGKAYLGDNIQQMMNILSNPELDFDFKKQHFVYQNLENKVDYDLSKIIASLL